MGALAAVLGPGEDDVVGAAIAWLERLTAGQAREEAAKQAGGPAREQAPEQAPEPRP